MSSLVKLTMLAMSIHTARSKSTCITTLTCCLGTNKLLKAWESALKTNQRGEWELPKADVRQTLETETKQRSPTLSVPASAPQEHLPPSRLLQHKRISGRLTAPPSSLAIVRKRLAARHALATPAGNFAWPCWNTPYESTRSEGCGGGDRAVADGRVFELQPLPGAVYSRRAGRS